MHVQAHTQRNEYIFKESKDMILIRDREYWTSLERRWIANDEIFTHTWNFKNKVKRKKASHGHIIVSNDLYAISFWIT